jgi:hypothetical protein
MKEGLGILLKTQHVQVIRLQAVVKTYRSDRLSTCSGSQKITCVVICVAKSDNCIKPLYPEVNMHKDTNPTTSLKLSGEQL